MDAHIAHVAKNTPFDAAHYTWLLVKETTLNEHSEAKLNPLLLAHGDYAAPIVTWHLRMPFEHIAFVYLMDNKEYLLLTLDCVNSFPKQSTLWSHEPLANGSRNVTTLIFNPTLEEREFYKKYQDMSLNEVYGVPLPKDPERLVLMDFSPSMTQKDKMRTVTFASPFYRRLLRYVAAASDGLLQGESIECHIPTANPANAKRIRKGKAPLFEWRTVPLARKAPELPAAPQGGTHASPRLHQRRGHWATSKLGKKFWRRETVVGNPENGMIFHDYTDQKDTHV